MVAEAKRKVGRSQSQKASPRAWEDAQALYTILIRTQLRLRPKYIKLKQSLLMKELQEVSISLPENKIL